jgi:hypothetical protein
MAVSHSYYIIRVTKKSGTLETVYTDSHLCYCGNSLMRSVLSLDQVQVIINDPKTDPRTTSRNY